jgi:subtilisin
MYQQGQPLPSSPGARVAAAEALTEQFLSTRKITNVKAAILSSRRKQTIFLANLTEKEAQQLEKDPTVTSVEPERIVSVCSCVDVSAGSTLKWNVAQTGYGRGDLQPSTKTAWVIDSGIDLDHPDLNVDIARSRSFVTGRTSPDDEDGHGTHVAGIIGAKNNGFGITGLASGATLVSLRTLDHKGEGALNYIIQAVDYVLENGRAGDVVNISINGPTSTATQSIIMQAAEAGILFAVAAGNDGEDVVHSWAGHINHPNIFTVSAMDRNHQFASFSNFGSSVDICAYGVNITSTYLNGNYTSLSGTSMAAPHVAGLLFIKGNNIPMHGTVTGDPDGIPDPMLGEGY